MRETDKDAVMERVAEGGNLLGFSIMSVSCLSKGKPLVAELVARAVQEGGARNQLVGLLPALIFDQGGPPANRGLGCRP